MGDEAPTTEDAIADRDADPATDPPSVERRPPQAVFSLLGNETRIEILYALGESLNEAVSFSTLQDRVGTLDSGQFNYHLGKLADHFVRKTESGYRLTLAGTQIIGALRAGRYTADVTMDPIDLDSACPTCDGTVRVTYEDEHVRMNCVDCAEWGNQFPFPPGTIEQFDRGDLPIAFDRYLRTQLIGTVAGFCPNCAGRIDGRLEVDDDRRHGVAAAFDCERCGEVAQFTPYAILLDHPTVVSFYDDHGVDVTETPSWELERVSDLEVDVIEVQPTRTRVTIGLEGDRLRATIGEDATVDTVERIPD